MNLPHTNNHPVERHVILVEPEIHWNTGNIGRTCLAADAFLHLIKPLGFLEFLQLEANASLILTDSGGMQEEACILGVPCLTYRDNTERPETIEVGSNILLGIKGTDVLNQIKRMENIKKWHNPFGDGTTAKKIVEILLTTE